MDLLKKKREVFGTCFALFFMTFSVLGCVGLGKYGKADTNYFANIKEPTGLKGQTKKEIIKTLGVPDSTVIVAGIDYWRFRSMSGFYVVAFGRTQEKDLILEFKGDKVKTSYLVDKGFSMGILGGQGAMSN
jgi:hypothetical protein